MAKGRVPGVDVKSSTDPGQDSARLGGMHGAFLADEILYDPQEEYFYLKESAFLWRKTVIEIEAS